MTWLTFTDRGVDEDFCNAPIVFMGQGDYAWSDTEQWCGPFSKSYGSSNIPTVVVNDGTDWMTWYFNQNECSKTVQPGTGSPPAPSNYLSFEQMNQVSWPVSATNGGAYDKTADAFLLIGDGGSAYTTDDFGETWTTVTAAPFGIGGHNLAVAITENSQTDLYFAGSSVIMHTDDTGATWSSQTSAFNFSARGLTYSRQEDNFYVCVSGQSSDSAIWSQSRALALTNTWTKVFDLGDSIADSAHGIDSNYDTGTIICIYGTNENSIARKEFGSDTWTTSVLVSGVGTEADSIVYVPERRVWLISSTDSTETRISYDDGLTWSLQDNTPDVGQISTMDHRRRWTMYDF